MKLPKILELDYKKWRAGSYGDNRIGEGRTTLLNKQGYMCCLGQFCKQAGLSKSDINSSLPSELVIKVKGLATKHRDTALTCWCVGINDNPSIDTAERVKLLKKVLGKYHRKLLLRNFPKLVIEKLKKMRVKVDVVQQANKKNKSNT